MKHKEIDNQRAEVTPLDEQASTYLRKNGATRMAQLYNAFRVRNPSLSDVEVTAFVWHLVEEGQVDVEVIHQPPSGQCALHTPRFGLVQVAL